MPHDPAARQQSRAVVSEAEPAVAVMMAVRQEGTQLEAVLASVLAQDYLRLRHVAIAVGPSTDTTRELVERAAAQDPRVLVLPNPEGVVSTGLNRALRVITEPLVVRVDGHCLVPPHYVRALVADVRATGASCVGPRLRTVGRSRLQRAVAAAMSSVLGVGASRFRTSDRSGDVDTVAFGIYERQTLLALGGFRPELVRNQDDELNARLRRAGGRIYLDANLSVDYFPRATLRGVWRQYFEYGYWRTVTACTCGDRLRARQLAPGVLVGGLVGGAGLAALGKPRPVLGATTAYGALLAGLALQTLQRTREPAVAVLAVPAGLVLHLSYGCGLWCAALQRAGQWRSRGPRP